jgi:O-antigen/teichoic acid export membrane protein
MSLKKEVAKNNVVFTAGNIGSALLSFAFSIVVANLLPPDQFGLFSFSLVVMGFFIIFTDLGITNIMIKFVSEWAEARNIGRTRSIIRVMAKIEAALTLCVAVFMFFTSEWISAAVFNKPGYGMFISLASLLLIANVAFNFTVSVLVGFKRFGHVVAAKLAERAMRLCMVAGMIVLGFGAVGAVLGVVAAFAVAAFAGSMIIVSRHGRFVVGSGAKLQRRVVFSFGSWVLVGTVVASLYNTTDSLLVSMLRSIEEVGFYSIASSWMSLVTYVVPVSATVMYTYFSSLKGEGNILALRNSLKYTLAAVMPVGFLMSAFSAPIISIFYAQSYLPAASALGMLGLSAIPLMVSQIMIVYFYGTGRPGTHTAVISAMFVADVAMSYFFISGFGIWGAGAAMLIARSVEVAILLGIVSLKSKGIVSLPSIMKSLVAALIVYIIAAMLPVTGIVQLVAAGVALLLAYLGVLVAIGGISLDEAKNSISWVRSFFLLLRWRKA